MCPSENALEHWLQGNSFSPEYVVKWVFKLSTFEKALVHWLLGNGFSPVWVLEWVSRLLMLLNFFDKKCKDETFFDF